MIKEEDGKFYVLSEEGKHLGGPYKTREEAKKRLAQVEMFKALRNNGAISNN